MTKLIVEATKKDLKKILKKKGTYFFNGDPCDIPLDTKVMAIHKVDAINVQVCFHKDGFRFRKPYHDNATLIKIKHVIIYGS